MQHLNGLAVTLKVFYPFEPNKPWLVTLPSQDERRVPEENLELIPEELSKKKLFYPGAVCVVKRLTHQKELNGLEVRLQSYNVKARTWACVVL